MGSILDLGGRARGEAKRYKVPVPVPCCAVGTGHGRAGQGRAGTYPHLPAPCPPAPWPRPCTHVSIWCGRAARGAPGSQSSAGRPVARLLAWDQRGGVEGVEAIDGTEQGSFAREGCPALGHHAWPLPGPPTPKSEFRSRALPLSPSSLAPTVCGPLAPSGALWQLQCGAQGCGSWAGLWAVDARKLQAALPK